VTLQESIGQSREERNVESLEDESFFAEEDFERELEDDLKEDFEKIRDRDRSTPTLELDDESKEDRDIPHNQRLDDTLFPQTQDTVQTTPYPTKLFVICSVLYTFSQVTSWLMLHPIITNLVDWLMWGLVVLGITWTFTKYSGGEISGVGVVIEDCTSKVWDMAKVFQPVTLVLSACKEILVKALYSLLNYFYAMRVYYTEGYIPVLQRFYAR